MVDKNLQGDQASSDYNLEAMRTNNVNEDTHDRVIRLEERFQIWTKVVEKRLENIYRMMMWVMGMISLIGVGVITAILTRPEAVLY